MNATAELHRPTEDMSDDMLRLLHYAAGHKQGHLHALRVPGTRNTHRDKATLRLIEIGYAKWETIYDPVITEAGRIAIGAPPVLGDERWKAQMAAIREQHAAEQAERVARYEAMDRSNSFLNREPEPVSEECLARLRKPKKFGKRSVCVAMVILGKRPAGVFASTDGGEEKKVFLPFKARVKVECEYGRWAAVTMPGWLLTDRKIDPDDASGLPLPTSDEGDRTAAIQHARRCNDEMRPARSSNLHRRDAGIGSPW